MNYLDFIQNSFTQSAQNILSLSQNLGLQQEIARVAELIVESYKKGGKLFIAGNGGSAADAQHIAAELVAKLSQDRTSIPAFAMTTDTSLLTAIGNDYGYDFVFARQVQGLMQENDIFLAITTSGNSPNILKALQECRRKKVKTVLLSGKDGGLAKKENSADYYILAPGAHTAQIQEAHIAIYHTVCFLIENALVESGHVQYAKSF